MEPIVIRRGTTAVELTVPMFSKDILVDLEGTATETVTPMDLTGYAIEFTFRKFHVPPNETALVEITPPICKVGSVTNRLISVNGTYQSMEVALYVTEDTIFDTVGKVVVTVTITQGSVIRTPNEEIIFKVIPNEHC